MSRAGVLATVAVGFGRARRSERIRTLPPLEAPASPSDRTLPSCCREESPRVSGSEPVLAASGVAAAGFLGEGHHPKSLAFGAVLSDRKVSMSR